MDERVTDGMVAVAAAAWPDLDDSTDMALFGAVYRIMRAADPLAAAERAVLEAAIRWHEEGCGLEWVSFSVLDLLRLRAAQARQG